MNAPRIVSIPSSPASATKPTSRRIAIRTPSWAEVSSSARRVVETRSDRPASTIASPTRTTSTANPTSRTTLEPEPDEPEELVEKKRETRRIVPNSASDALARITCPNSLSISPASRTTGTIRPSDVDASTIATKSGLRISSTDCSANEQPTARTSDTPNASEIVPMRPRSRAGSISSPARNSRNASPMSDRTVTGRSSSSHPSPDGPTTMPMTISSATAGSRSAARG